MSSQFNAEMVTMNLSRQRTVSVLHMFSPRPIDLMKIRAGPLSAPTVSNDDEAFLGRPPVGLLDWRSTGWKCRRVRG